MSQSQTELERLRAELETAKRSAPEALRELQSEKEASARARNAHDAVQATLSKTEERLGIVQDDRKKIWEMYTELKIQAARSEVKLESAQEALSQAQEGSESL